ncbi:hypothetical protein [Olleya sp. R77988]|uniref:hypothetical protein n=1 Tax=Olleya sp. R77988 TaxID=3093875 RepID=UPI0037C5F7CA
MRFRIGAYSVRLKTYNSNDLSLPEKYNHLKFQLYQKVFYILFIPVLPIELFWKIKDANTNKEASSDAELRTKLNLFSLNKKSPFWTYSGLMILLAPFIFLAGYLILNFGEKQIKNIEKSIENDKVNFRVVENIKAPILNDVYHIKLIEMIPQTDVNGKVKSFKKGERETLKYKVLSFSEDSLSLVLIETPKFFFADILLKDTVKVLKNKLIDISDSYKTIDLYTPIKDKNIIKAEAVFNIDNIIRE